MIWEGEKYPWSIMKNADRIGLLTTDVFPTYLNEFVRSAPARKDVIKEYKVRCDLFGCSDPRVHTDFFGGYPGEIFIKRGVGGKFCLGNSTFRAKFGRVLDKTESKDLNHIILISFHYSMSDSYKGCAGHGYNDVVAKNYAQKLFEEMRDLFSEKKFIIPILCGLETDRGGVTLFGHDGSALFCPDAYKENEGEIFRKLFYMYDGFPDNVLFYLVKCVQGNGKYVNEIHPTDLEVLQTHNEFCIGFGEGFFSFPRGRIMVVNPFSYPFSDESHLIDALRIQSNLQEKEIIKNGFLMVSGAIYDEEDEKKWAIAESLDYLKTAQQVIQKHFRHLIPLVAPFPIIMHRESRKVTALKNF